MSWYTGQDGQKTWIERNAMVYNIVESDEQLPLEQLTYLAVQSKKAVYHEAVCDDDLSATGKSKRQRDKQSGRQRGYIIRTDVDEHPLSRVVPWFKAAVQKLMDFAAVSRVDADEVASTKKKKNNSNREKAAETTMPNLGSPGVNECRIQTTSRIQHFAHGPGYRVEVMEGMAMQRLHLFTCRREIPAKDWLTLLISALESSGCHVMLARKVQGSSEVASMPGALPADKEIGAENAKREGESDVDIKIQLRKDVAQQEENAWLQTMMDSCTLDNREGDTGKGGTDVIPIEHPRQTERPVSPKVDELYRAGTPSHIPNQTLLCASEECRKMASRNTVQRRSTAS
ncbi:unnamed protein product [Polarella glacialis]|uniref:Uncharacterized protein n=1 Tax=Polarella glacialis TaxID=89957 RepID=A0A813FEZ1_POLGL|nr:unnamed protein product [Polarella glacialis]